MPRGAWAATVLLVAIGAAAPAAAQPLSPLGPAPMEALPPAAAPIRGSAPLEHPPSILGAPIAVRGEMPPSATDSFSIPAGYVDPPAVQRPARAAGLGVPMAAGGIEQPALPPIAASAVETRIREIVATAPPAADAVNDFLTRRANHQVDPAPRPELRSKSGWKFGENLDGMLGERGEWLRSDHAFDGFISPVTNPFLFEDPRSLTEVRPLFIYQKVPNGQRDFQGGNVSFFGVQGRVAVTDRLSFVVNKLGGIWENPSSSSSVGAQSGFAEVWLGPKYTFIRSEDACSLVAGGLQFQLPVGSVGAQQSNGSLSLVPYVSAATNIFKDFSYGSFNLMGNTGYAIGTSSARSDYWYISGHIDMDVMNWHRIYPLFEMNYFVVTKNGNTTPIGAEGRDLINFGGQAAGKGLLTGAFGARFKISESSQLGGAFEIPFAGPKDLFQYRFTIDFILRY